MLPRVDDRWRAPRFGFVHRLTGRALSTSQLLFYTSLFYVLECSRDQLFLSYYSYVFISTDGTLSRGRRKSSKGIEH